MIKINLQMQPLEINLQTKETYPQRSTTQKLRFVKAIKKGNKIWEQKIIRTIIYHIDVDLINLLLFKIKTIFLRASLKIFLQLYPTKVQYKRKWKHRKLHTKPMSRIWKHKIKHKMNRKFSSITNPNQHSLNWPHIVKNQRKQKYHGWIETYLSR